MDNNVRLAWCQQERTWRLLPAPHSSDPLLLILLFPGFLLEKHAQVLGNTTPRAVRLLLECTDYLTVKFTLDTNVDFTFSKTQYFLLFIFYIWLLIEIVQIKLKLNHCFYYALEINIKMKGKVTVLGSMLNITDNTCGK